MIGCCAMVIKAQENIKYYDIEWKECAAGEACYISIVKPAKGLWERTDYFNGTRYVQMHGYYLDSGCQVQHGDFTWWYPNRNISRKGEYSFGKKKGIWLGFHYNGVPSDSAWYENGQWQGQLLRWHSNAIMKDSIEKKDDGTEVMVSWFDNGNPSSAGILLNGKPHKTWQFFHINGNMAATETYDNGNLVSKRYYSETGELQSETTDTDREALFGQAPGDWKKYIEKNVYFPSQYTINDGNKVVVSVSGTVNENGEVEDVYVNVPVHPEFDRILLNTIKKSRKWKPAISHNRRVKHYFYQPLSFVMED